MSPPAAGPLADRSLEVETPELVSLGYELADLGSRFAALAIDGLYILASVASLWIVLLLAAALTGAAIFGSLVLAVLVIVSFAFPWGYRIWFEGFREGRTPGKKRMGIRAIHEEGYPLTVRGAVVRNLLLLVDVQPAGSCLVGGLTMLLHPRTQRPGDLAAGSVVVRERTEGAVPEAVALEGRTGGAPLLGDDEFEVLTRYVERREALAPGLRRRLSHTLAERFADRAPFDPVRQTPDEHLRHLYSEEAARRSRGASRTGVVSPRAVALLREQGGRWSRFGELVEGARSRGLHRLPDEVIEEFALLYREVAADLARARTYGASPALLRTLQGLVGQGHNLIYRREGRSARSLVRWLRGGFPALVRLRWAPVALAAALFFGPAFATWGVTRADPELAREFLPPVLLTRAEEGREAEAAGRGYVEVPEVLMPVMATSLIANNVQVTLVAFAGGILAGLGTVWILVLNGVVLGGVAGLFGAYGLDLHLWSFVLPHGVVELTAICVAGGAGLWIGSALWIPGRLTRKEALRRRGREGVALLAGTTLLLMAAGLIEGFVSPSDLPRAAKLLFAGVAATLLALYLGGSGRDDPSRRQAAAVAEPEMDEVRGAPAA